MRIDLKSSPLKLAAIVIEVAVFAFLAVWITRAYLATVISRTPTVPNLLSASHLDPSDSMYALQLGRMYQYSIMDAKPALALPELRRAVRLNPYDPQAWRDLGAALEFQGKTKEAEACLRRVDYLAPDIPAYQWSIGNFFLLHGDTDEAFRHFKIVLASSPGYSTTIYNLAWKASGDANQILRELIPEIPLPEIYYLDYLLATNRLEDGAPVWKRIAASSGGFSANDVSTYIDALITAHHPEQAYHVWSVLREKGLIPATYQATPQNLVENGDFEQPPLDMGFDWRNASGAEIFTSLDTSVYHSASHSLLIQFPGTQNFDFHNYYQFVRVIPDHYYRLSGYMKTDGITTESGPRLEVRDAYKPSRFDQYSKDLTGTTADWEPLNIYFKTPAKTRLLAVIIARVPSQMFKNKIAGRFWVDDISLVPEGGPPGSPQAAEAIRQ